jgi:hypothetical protein
MFGRGPDDRWQEEPDSEPAIAAAVPAKNSRRETGAKADLEGRAFFMVIHDGGKVDSL